VAKAFSYYRTGDIKAKGTVEATAEA
jgi:hypothetical protein